jgi:hypothetical protein
VSANPRGPPVSPPRSIEPFLLVRFVRDYAGPHGKPFRDAAAEHFGVSGRTVERELPRLASLGVLVEETLPGRGAPKRYSVHPGVKDRKWRGAAPRRTIFERAARRRDVGTDDPAEVERWFRAGVLAICHRCGRATVVQTYEPTPDCPEWVRGGHGPMLRAPGFPAESEPRDPEGLVPSHRRATRVEVGEAELARNVAETWRGVEERLAERASDPS